METHNAIAVQENSAIIGFDPDTADLIAKMLRQRRNSKTETTDVKERVGKAGAKYKYVTSAPIFKWLDENYPLWSWEAHDGHVTMGDFVHVRGTLTVRGPLENGYERTITSWGADEAIVKNADGKLSTFPYLKSAETDALKRCVVKLGGFNDVYGYEDESADKAVMTKEDMDWYLTTVVPTLANGDILFKQMRALIDNVITIDDLKQRY